jgi:hypothetical protein
VGESVSESLATIQDLRDLFIGNLAFPESKVVELEKQLELATDFVRVEYNDVDIDAILATNEVAKRRVANIVAEMVKRSFEAGVSEDIPNGEFSEISRAAGGYSFSAKPVSSGSGFYFRGKELEQLKKLFAVKKQRVFAHKMYSE